MKKAIPAFVPVVCLLAAGSVSLVAVNSHSEQRDMELFPIRMCVHMAVNILLMGTPFILKPSTMSKMPAFPR